MKYFMMSDDNKVALEVSPNEYYIACKVYNVFGVDGDECVAYVPKVFIARYIYEKFGNGEK